MIPWKSFYNICSENKNRKMPSEYFSVLKFANILAKMNKKKNIAIFKENSNYIHLQLNIIRIGNIRNH